MQPFSNFDVDRESTDHTDETAGPSSVCKGGADSPRHLGFQIMTCLAFLGPAIRELYTLFPSAPQSLKSRTIQHDIITDASVQGLHPWGTEGIHRQILHIHVMESQHITLQDSLKGLVFVLNGPPLS